MSAQSKEIVKKAFHEMLTQAYLRRSERIRLKNLKKKEAERNLSGGDGLFQIVKSVGHYLTKPARGPTWCDTLTNTLMFIAVVVVLAVVAKAAAAAYATATATSQAAVFISWFDFFGIGGKIMPTITAWFFEYSPQIFQLAKQLAASVDGVIILALFEACLHMPMRWSLKAILQRFCYCREDLIDNKAENKSDVHKLPDAIAIIDSDALAAAREDEFKAPTNLSTKLSKKAADTDINLQDLLFALGALNNPIKLQHIKVLDEKQHAKLNEIIDVFVENRQKRINALEAIKSHMTLNQKIRDKLEPTITVYQDQINELKKHKTTLATWMECHTKLPEPPPVTESPRRNASKFKAFFTGLNPFNKRKAPDKLNDNNKRQDNTQDGDPEVGLPTE